MMAIGSEACWGDSYLLAWPASCYRSSGGSCELGDSDCYSIGSEWGDLRSRLGL